MQLSREEIEPNPCCECFVYTLLNEKIHTLTHSSDDLPKPLKKEEEFETDFILIVFHHIWPFLRDVRINRSQSIIAVLISLQGCAYSL